MSKTYPLFLQVALAEDIPERGLKQGDVATVVEHTLSQMGKKMAIVMHSYGHLAFL